MLILIGLTTFLIPFYFLRFSLGVPTNIFEVAVVVSFIVFLIHRTKAQTYFKWGSWPIYLILFFATVALVVSHGSVAALGIWKGWFIIPYLYYLLVINCL